MLRKAAQCRKRLDPDGLFVGSQLLSEQQRAMEEMRGMCGRVNMRLECSRAAEGRAVGAERARTRAVFNLVAFAVAVVACVVAVDDA